MFKVLGFIGFWGPRLSVRDLGFRVDGSAWR